MIRIRELALSVVLCLAALSSSTAEGSVVVGALKGPSGIGMIRLFGEPPSLPGGLALRPVAVASVDLMTAKLVSGEYDAGVLPINVAAKLRSSGTGIKLAAVVGEGMLSFLSADESIESLADLRGKRVNVAGQGATPDYLFRKLLRGAGLDPSKDLSLDYALPYPEAASALASGAIAYAILPEPFSTMARRLNPKLKEVLDLGALWTKQTGQDGYPMTCFVVSASLAERPALVRSVLEAYKASIAWTAAHPAEAGRLVEAEGLGLKAAVATAAIPRLAQVFKEGEAARPEVEALLGAFLELSPASIGGKLPDDGFYGSF